MLQLPQKGFSPSKKTINVSSDCLGDWIEASLLFDSNEVTKSEIVDLLIEEQICEDDDQDMAHFIADLGWSEIEQRKNWGGTSALQSIIGPRITDIADWREEPVRAFLVMLSILKLYPDWAKNHINYIEQGDLFELVIQEVCPSLLPGWTVIRSGWSPNNAVSITTIVAELCAHLNTQGAHNLDDWVDSAAKDGGLDIVCVRKFSDTREALPTFFLQCASGTNWRGKVHTPNPMEWLKYLDAAVQPSTGLVAPFVLNDRTIKQAGLQGQIIVFDRIRILDAINNSSFNLTAATNQRVVDWIESRLADIPKFEN